MKFHHTGWFKTIIENDIKVYKYHFCICGCEERIPYNYQHIYRGIPEYKINHDKKLSLKEYKKTYAKILSEPTIVKNGIKYYKNYFCECETKCGNRIPYPTNKKTIERHNRNGIPKFVKDHYLFGKNKGNKHSRWSKHLSQETKDKISKGNLGKRVSKKSRQKMSRSKSGEKCYWYGRPPPKSSSYGKGCYYNSPLQGKIWLRSTYELKYAKYLDLRCILWKYEYKTFKLSNGTTYTPDFYLVKKKKYREIKGYMSKYAQEKIELFQKEYNKNFKILYKEDLIKKGILTS